MFVDICCCAEYVRSIYDVVVYDVDVVVVTGDHDCGVVVDATIYCHCW